MLLTRFVPKHQHFLDGIALVHLKQGGGKGSLKNYAREFQAKMVSCKEVNEYSKLVIFYAGLDEGTRQKYFEREHVLESLDEALALADTLLGESSASGVSHEPGWKGKAANPGKHKHEKTKNFKRKFEEGDHKNKKEASGSGDKKKSRHDNDTCYNCQEKGHLAKDCVKPAKPREHKDKKVLATMCEPEANSVLPIVSDGPDMKEAMMRSGDEVQSSLKRKKKKVMGCLLPGNKVLECRTPCKCLLFDTFLSMEETARKPLTLHLQGSQCTNPTWATPM